jgi:cytochrome c oxidase assembly protein subunit 15
MTKNLKLVYALRVLLVMIIGLMALGAGVRAMNAGLSCPDWPLCFGKVIPDFHPAVWFEFVHRAYAGAVSLVFLGVCSFVLLTKRARPATRVAAIFGIFFLFMQIAAGALTVLWLVKWFAVTSHLMLATLFFCSVLAMLLSEAPTADTNTAPAPPFLKSVAAILSGLVFLQILFGGIVASTYAGSVCVDWPLCNGEWVPTWAGAIGHQIAHRFLAYLLVVLFVAFACAIQKLKSAPWMTRQLLFWSRLAAIIVFVQVGIGIANLILFIPPSLTVIHQSVAIVLLATSLRLFQLARALCYAPVSSMENRLGSFTTSKV